MNVLSMDFKNIGKSTKQKQMNIDNYKSQVSHLRTWLIYMVFITLVFYCLSNGCNLFLLIQYFTRLYYMRCNLVLKYKLF